MRVIVRDAAEIVDKVSYFSDAMLAEHYGEDDEEHTGYPPFCTPSLSRHP